MLHFPSAILYGLLSSVMVFGNKYLLNTWNFNYPIFTILAQIIVTIFVTLLHNKNIFAEFYFDRIYLNRNHVLTAFFYSLHSITALKALNGLNIPIYTTFKRCTPLVNLILSFFMFKHQHQLSDTNLFQKIFNKINFCIFIMAVGVIFAGLGDLKFDRFSYLYCGISVVLQAFYFSFIQKCSETESDPFRTLSLTSLYSLPILAICFFLFNEHIDLLALDKNEYLLNVGFCLSAAGVILSGCVLCFSQIWCTTMNNAITTSVIGVLKSFIQSAFGLFFFHAYQTMTGLAIFGIFVNVIFGSWYTYLKYVEKEKKKKPTSQNIA